MMILNITCQAACHGKTEHGIFVKFKKLSKTAVVLIAGVTISGTPCPRHFIVPFGAEALSSLKKRAKLLLSSLPVSPSRVLRAPGTSSYHLVPKHLRATWPRPEQSHLLPEACSPNGTDNRQQRQRRAKRPPPEPSDILKRFHALYDDKLRYYMKKVSKLYCYYNPLRDMGHIRPIAFSSNFQKNLSVKGLMGFPASLLYR